MHKLLICTVSLACGSWILAAAENQLPGDRETNDPIVITIDGTSEETQLIELPDGVGAITIDVNTAIAESPTSDGSKGHEGTWLGAGIGPVPEAVSTYLDLPEGIYISIGEIVDGSPAANAGLKVGDIVTFMDEQEIMNADQFIQLIRRRAPGEKVTLKILRKGKEKAIDVVLSSHTFARTPARNPGNELLRQFEFHNRPGAVSPPAPPQFKPFAGGGGPIQQETHRSTARSSTIQNDQGTFSFSEHNGDKTFTVKSPSGEVKFDGSVNTDEEREKVPEAYRDTLKQMDAGDFQLFPRKQKTPRKQIQPGSTL